MALCLRLFWWFQSNAETDPALSDDETLLDGALANLSVDCASAMDSAQDRNMHESWFQEQLDRYGEQQLNSLECDYVMSPPRQPVGTRVWNVFFTVLKNKLYLRRNTGGWGGGCWELDPISYVTPQQKSLHLQHGLYILYVAKSIITFPKI